ncbi:PHD finger protein 20-like protein 1 [Tolypocladium ophioglossoides CBS 100239]|uniref:PHD finger protein 20-like protein 1 n=1 Tax=Tolypocladium ophioglossoides (strain CBS 100239) TaxID=1163406 RepID=A0A0L0N1S4_TOLOC|nr:PHD finger protein 20-like protein 1 [Tolypocladium ophioglossoides CBS 100239]
MSEDHLASRQGFLAVLPPSHAPFGDPKAQPFTPKQSRASAAFPSPVFETPKHYQGSVTETGGLTPRFAEEYSVFNSTPGNLRGTHGPFTDFVPATPASSLGGHKRLLSAEGLAVEIAAHVNHFSPNPNLPLPPVDPYQRLPSSPDPSTILKGFSAESDISLSPTPSRSQSSKKARRGTISEQPEPSQVISPPPTARKGERKLAPKLNMQNDQTFGQPDFNDPTQQNMTAALMGNSGDIFGYPMSAPATAPANFWDTSMSVSMDLDFNVAGPHVFQPTLPHRHTGSFDWNADIQLFQDANHPASSSNQENVQPVRRERALAPKPPASGAAATGTSGGSAVQATHPTALDNPFDIILSGDGVDPGLLFSRPQTSAMDSDFNAMAQSGSAETAIAGSGKSQSGGQVHKSNSVRGARNGKLPDRAVASSPIRSSARPGLGRSYSENRGKRAHGRESLPTLAPAAQPAPQVNNRPSISAGRSSGRSSGRISPSKTMPRLSNLASIPETSPQYRPRTSVRFTIDAHGRARAETTVVGEVFGTDRGRPSSRSSRHVSVSRSRDSSDDDSSTDDEPIIIPSRNNSFNASFALPDPRKPVGSIFHCSKRSISDRSASNSANDAESEAETVVNERQNKGGDATSELRKVVEDRQKRSNQMGSARSQRCVSTSIGRNFPGGSISPTSLMKSSYALEGHGVRCVCDETSADEGGGFMLQCKSCEMWLHGMCINITRHSVPSVYICGFCANTTNLAGRRSRENALGIGGMVSPLANKSFRSFR